MYRGMRHRHAGGQATVGRCTGRQATVGRCAGRLNLAATRSPKVASAGIGSSQQNTACLAAINDLSQRPGDSSPRRHKYRNAW